jgi:hypothetical protein
VFPQVDFAQLLQTLLNQLAISSQLGTQQIAPSVSQPIEQVAPIAGHSNAKILPRQGQLQTQRPESWKNDLQKLQLRFK